MKANVAKHRLGAVATWSHSTDTIGANVINAEISAFKHNMALTVFDNSNYPIGNKKAMADTKRMRFNSYFPTDRWDDPNQPGTFPVIPDYMATSWTQKAVDAGFNVTVGASKPTRYPNHGQELFDVSDGLYGYDLVNDVAGQTDVLSGLVEHEREWMKNNFGYYPASASYRNGMYGALYGLGKYLSVRNSLYNVGDVGYSFSREDAKSLRTTMRQGDMPGTRTDIMNTATTALQKAIAENGWFSDFTHWHSIAEPNELYEFFENQRNTIAKNDVLPLDFGTALQHKFLTDMATVSIVDNAGTITVEVTYADPYGDLPLDVFTIPLSVEVDLSGSSLQGKEITSEAGIRKLDTDEFVVDVPFNGAEGVVTVNLTSTLMPDYIDLSAPSIAKCKLTGGQLTIQTDKHSNVVLFEVAAGAEIYNNPAVINRSNTESKTHTIAYEANGNDLYIGVISNDGQSILSAANPYNHEFHSGYINSFGEKIAFYEESHEDAPKIFIDGQVKYFKLVDSGNSKASNRRMFTGGIVKAFEKVTD